MVAADLCFSDVKYAKSLEEMGIGFICVAKHSSRQYPMAHLQRK